MAVRQKIIPVETSHFGGCLAVLNHGSEFGSTARAFGKDETRGSLLTASASLQGIM